MATLQAVRDQYAQYPYPPRDPADEHTRLVQDLLGQLPLIDHLFWGGRRHPGAGFRVLDAGCGTGDSAICVAERLRGSGGQVVALDFSAASLEIARQRAAVRGLENIEFVEGVLEELPALGLGSFDYVISSGVLHHLESPDAGLRALREVLKPDGGMALMVYGRYGRTGVYHLQDLLRLVAPPDELPEQRLRTVKRMLGRFRPEHPAALFADSWEREVAEGGDAALYDLFLHSQDRAYTVPEIYEWLDRCGMRLLCFDFPAAYEPATWDGRVPIEHLTPEQRHALAELLHGRMGNHTFFAVPASSSPPRPPEAGDESAVPVWTYHDREGNRASALEDGRALLVQAGPHALTVDMNGLTRALLRRVDGAAPLGAIFDGAATALSGVTRKQARAEWLRVYRLLRGVNYLVLNAVS